MEKRPAEHRGLAEISKGIESAISWADPGATVVLLEDGVTDGDWSRMATSSAIWIALPLAIGLARVRRQ